MSIWLSLARIAELEDGDYRLRPPRMDDLSDFVTILSKEGYLPYICPVPVSQEEAGNIFVTLFLKEPLGVWAIEDRVNQIMIGILRLDHIKEDRAELGYFLREDYQGRGIMTRLVTQVSDILLGLGLMKRLSIITHLTNSKSQSVAKRSGFRQYRQFKGSDRFSHMICDYIEWIKESV